MDPSRTRYWPFDVPFLKRRSEQSSREIHFLETAHKEGYKAYMFGLQNFGAEGGIRAGEIVYRGCRGRHWELFLTSAQKLIVSAHVIDFACAAEALLRWLRGGGPEEIVEHLKSHLFSTTATPTGVVIHSTEDPATDGSFGNRRANAKARSPQS